MQTPSVVGVLRAYPRWTVALLSGFALLSALQALFERRMGALEVTSIALGTVFLGLALKLLATQMLRLQRAGRFSPGEWKHVGAIFLIMTGGLIVSLPYLMAVLPHVELSEIPDKADWLDGGLVEVEGIVVMSEQSRNVVSSLEVKGQTCVTLLVTEDEFQALKKFHLRRSFVTGMFDKAGCAGLSNCRNSCGPYAIVHPSINPADRADEQ